MKEHISEINKEWDQAKGEFILGNPERQEKFLTNSGIELTAVYGPEALADGNEGFMKKEGYPGLYPYTRGITPTMYRSNLWVMGQYSGFGSAEDANKRYKYLLEQGQTGFSIALDLPTQIGYDSDHPLAEGEVGRVGVAIDSLADIEILFKDIPLHQVRQIRTTANAIGPVTVAMLVAFAEKNGINPNDIKILIQNDPLKEYIGRGAYIYPPKAAVKLAGDVIEYCAKNLPNWTPMAISGYHIRESGSTAIQELTFTLANAICYIDEILSRGINIDDFAPKFYTFLGAHIDFIEEIAKFRAVRRIWARLMKERYQAGHPESMKLSIFAYTCGGTLTAQQPLNNIVRVTIEALGAVLGGVQTLATSSYDEAFAIPTEEAVTVALRTQQIIAYESGAANTADPLGGSYVLEQLTKEIEKRVFEEISKIDNMGGAVKCIQEGLIQKEISDAAYRFQKQVENSEKVIVGLNRFRSREEARIPVFKTDPASEARQIKRLRELKEKRDNSLVKSRLFRVKEAAGHNENVIPAIIEAVRDYATLGEISDVLREVYGEYKAMTVY
ncbi:MAG: methylmalonyl-CoA mutase [Peptococcaceae bacterium BRH_c4b]|nr:MAG: methylmalonyl-CoA mutase [Peptococcaceae bacterium BRH_c4b]